jgi:uncharacterized protein (TIGR02996 family)
VNTPDDFTFPHHLADHEAAADERLLRNRPAPPPQAAADVAPTEEAMTEREQLLHAIRVEPLEDTPRLAYADWLDEHGDATDRDRAREIRDSILCPDRCPGVIVVPIAGDGVATVRRGFTDSVRLTTVRFLQYAERLFAADPIVAVQFTDKAPCFSSEGPWVWEYGSLVRASSRSFTVPVYHDLRDRMMAHPLRTQFKGFGRHDHALLALSECLVAICRKQARLPPLPLTSPGG